MKSTQKMCSTNIDEIIKLPVVNCLTFLWLSTNLWLQTVYAEYLKVSTSLQSESRNIFLKNQPLKKSHISPRYTQDSNQPVKDWKKSDQAGFHLDKPFIHTDWIQSFS